MRTKPWICQTNDYSKDTSCDLCGYQGELDLAIKTTEGKWGEVGYVYVCGRGHAQLMGTGLQSEV